MMGNSSEEKGNCPWYFRFLLASTSGFELKIIHHHSPIQAHYSSTQNGPANIFKAFDLIPSSFHVSCCAAISHHRRLISSLSASVRSPLLIRCPLPIRCRYGFSKSSVEPEGIKRVTGAHINYSNMSRLRKYQGALISSAQYIITNLSRA